MLQYHNLLKYVLKHGENKPNRTGEDTLSLFNYNYKVDLRKGFPLLTGKKVKFENVLFELLWFLSGNAKIDFLHKHGIKFWDQWIEDGRHLPEAYGEFWRAYPNNQLISNDIGYTESPSPRESTFDQFAAIINELKTNPNSRRMVMTNWCPPSAWAAKLPPCHLMCIFNVQYDEGKPYLNVEMLQRSADVPVGVPFNIASYALLLEIVGNMVNMPVRYFAHTLVDVHIYNNQMDAVNTYLDRPIKKLPTLNITERLTLDRLDDLIKNGCTEQIKSVFQLDNYNPEPYIKMPVMV